MSLGWQPERGPYRCCRPPCCLDWRRLSPGGWAAGPREASLLPPGRYPCPPPLTRTTSYTVLAAVMRWARHRNPVGCCRRHNPLGDNGASAV